ncbi:DHHC palmitoyltransferase-domain-containing protein [Lasiosphaeria hispida]|uniref:Palmitoyltransferase n=1 Tax=Lasiosphaeria hispida TaxID=260671 RepID=A0AAJ0ML25_9PEZI|nr:DHHC palmitoyltransferase-domain-containing protein [Lasiosphaeria hispida]
MVSARRPETRWVTRLIPFVLLGCLVFSTYAFVKHICTDFFIHSRHEFRAAIALLVVYFLFLVLMLLTYFRLFLVIQFNPGVLPLGPLAVEQRAKQKEERRKSGMCVRLREGDLEAHQYDIYSWPDPKPDSPGLEAFYSKDVFVCHTDGWPRWCSSCYNWKQDRAHHCSELNRCVKKMDHYCPWVGGIVGENSFKFFFQFTFYTTLYCVVGIVSAAFNVHTLIMSGAGVDGVVIGLLGVTAFFGLFAFSMTATSARYICLNLTNVDYLKAKTLVHQVAIRVPRGTPPSIGRIASGLDYQVITYPLSRPKPEATEPSPQSSGRTVIDEPVSPRDLLATRTFAIVRTEKGENPWDLGVYGNWKSVMGNNIIDWLLPFNPSPCESAETNESFYQMGPLYQQLRSRYNLPEIPASEKGGVELDELEKQREHRGGGTRTRSSR